MIISNLFDMLSKEMENLKFKHTLADVRKIGGVQSECGKN